MSECKDETKCDVPDMPDKMPEKEESDMVKLEEVVKQLNVTVEQLRADMLVTHDTILGYDVKNEGKVETCDVPRPLNRIISVGMSISSIHENIAEINNIRSKIHDIFEK